MKTAFRNIVLLLLLTMSASSFAQLKRSTTVYKEFYPDGTLKKVTRVKTVQSAKFELYDNYKKTIVTSTEYFENGKVKQKMKKITKLGNSGRDCYQITYEVRTYYETGIIKQVDIEKCDRVKTETRYYDESGNLTFTCINYHFS